MKELFAPPGMYAWDQWFIKKDRELYAFFLQLSEQVGKQGTDGISIGYARAIDKTLLHWKYLGTAIEPGTKSSDWDSQATWTGSIIQRKDGTYAQLYTGRRKHEDEYWIQRIGLATSKDLQTWEKNPGNPILESDQNYYEMDNVKTEQGNIKAWRDPFLFHSPQTNKIYAIISANKKCGGDYGAAIALAEALNDELSRWKIHPPLLSPRIYAEMEASQILHHKGTWYVFFYTWIHKMHPEYAKEQHITGGGMQCYYADDLFDQFKPVNGNGSVTTGAEKPYGMYCAKLIDTIDENTYRGLGWLYKDEQGTFIGTFSRPFTLTIEKDRVRFKTYEE